MIAMVPWLDSSWVTSSLTLGWTMPTSDPEEASFGRLYLPTLQMEKLRLRYLSTGIQAFAILS